MGDTGFFRGEWLPVGVEKPAWLKWCGRCLMELPRHSHLGPKRSRTMEEEARLQVVYTGLGE